MIVAVSSAVLGWEFLALVFGRRTWSRARGRQRVLFAGWLVALVAHVGYEWMAEDVARAAAEAL